MSQTDEFQDIYKCLREDEEIEDIYTDRMFNEIVNQPRSISSDEWMHINDTFDLLEMESQAKFEDLYKLPLEDPACKLNESQDYNFLFEDKNSKPTEEKKPEEVIEPEKNQSSTEKP